MDHTERFDSVEDPDDDPFAAGASGAAPYAAPADPSGAPVDLSGGPADSSALARFDGFAAGAPGGPRIPGDTGIPGAPGTPGAFDGAWDDEGPAAAGRLEAAEDFHAFGGFGPGPAQGSGFDAFGIAAAAAEASEERAAAGGSFDAFAAGAVRPAGESLALPAVRSTGEASLFDATTPVPKVIRPARDPLAPELGSGSGSGVRVQRVVTADYVLTLNPVDGTEVTVCPPEERRTPVRRTREERAARINAARPAPPPGPPAPELPLLERDEERERLIRLLARGRSIRVTGPSGTGRTALLESVANACGELAPDGVISLSGYHRTPADLLQDLYAVVYAGDGYRPGRAELSGLLRDVGAVVILDDLECGGDALEELLAAAPECAFVMSATPDVPPPAADSMVEEVFLSGLTRVTCVDLLQLAAGRPLEEDEAAWAADLWFESEGLPLRFVQAGALLRQRDALRQPPEPDWDDSVWEKGTPPAPAAPAGPLTTGLTGFDPGTGAGLGTGFDDGFNTGPGPGTGAGFEPPAAGSPAAAGLELPTIKRLPAAVPLPSLAESAAPAELLASRLSESAREALAFAVALDGECPHASHLPALVGDTHGDAALGELTSVGLAVPVSAHFRLAAGVVQHLTATFADEGELTDVQAHTAALHYAWWTGHPSVTPERATAESEAILAAMTACRDGGHPGAAVLLARTVASAFAAALHWGAWERALRIGQEAARLSGEVSEEAYFLHELGVLALCTGNTDRARAELEASIALRGALADRQGTVVGRRTLALVDDAAPGAAGASAAFAGGPLELLPAPAGAAASDDTLAPADPAPVVISRTPGHAAASGGPGGPSARRLAVVGSRRNLVAGGTGVLLAAVLGTIVTLGATSGGNDTPDNQVKPIESVQQDAPDGTTSAATTDGTSTPPSTSASPSTTAASATAPGTPSTSASPSTTAPEGGVTSPPGTTAPGHGGNPSSTPSKTRKPKPPTTSSSPPTSPSPTTPPPTTSPTSPSPPTDSRSATGSPSVTASDTTGSTGSTAPTSTTPSDTAAAGASSATTTPAP
jgi:hypothetical protein